VTYFTRMLESLINVRVKQPSASIPPRLSIVVLPLANIGGDPEQEYFVNAGSFVIGRNSAFTYKGKHVDLKQIGRELNVRYVLEGSVRRAGNFLGGCTGCSPKTTEGGAQAAV
jgi:TolB-like protein